MGKQNRPNQNEDRPNRPNRPNRPRPNRNQPVGRQPGSRRWYNAAARAAGRRGGGSRDIYSGIEEAAQADVQAAYGPALSSYDDAMAGVRSAYGGYASELAPLAGQYQAATAGLAGDLNAQLAELTGMLGQSGSTGELAAAAGYYGNIGATGLEGLASAGSRVGGFLSAAAAEGSAAQRAALDNLMQGKMGLSREMSQAVLARMDELRSQRLQESMALADQRMQRQAQRLEARYLKNQMASEDAYSQMLQQMIQGKLGGQNGRQGTRGNRGANPVVNPRRDDRPPRDNPRNNNRPGPRNTYPTVAATGSREGGDYYIGGTSLATKQGAKKLAKELAIKIAGAKSMADIPSWLVHMIKNPYHAQYLTPIKKEAFRLVRDKLLKKIETINPWWDYESPFPSYG